MLVRPMTRKEVFHSLKSMAKGKNPGLDGLNIQCYLHYWELVGDHHYKAIDHFFNHASSPDY